jgi:hypothetical protein
VVFEPRKLGKKTHHWDENPKIEKMVVFFHDTGNLPDPVVIENAGTF